MCNAVCAAQYDQPYTQLLLMPRVEPLLVRSGSHDYCRTSGDCTTGFACTRSHGTGFAQGICTAYITDEALLCSGLAQDG